MRMFDLESEATLSACRRNLFVFATLVIIILSIYSNTFDASWHFDDASNIQSRGAIHLKQFTWSGIKQTFFLDPSEKGPLASGSLYRPVVNFTFAMNYYFGELNVFGYHLVNISIHIMASIFLFLFIYHTLNLPLLRPRYGQESYFIAFLATVFWAINPVQTQAITYIVQRMASMAAMFYIMSMYFFLKGRISQNRWRKRLFFILCCLFGILAVGSKENAAMLPISILIFDLFLIQGLTKENLKKSGLVLLILIIIPPLFALILKGPSVFDPNRILNQYEVVRPFTLIERLLTEPRVILFYISLLLYPMPFRLSICHDILISHSLIDPPTTIISILAILGVLGFCIVKSSRWPFITYCIIFFFINHITEGSFFGLELIFEHRNYLPSMLLFAPLAVLFAKGIRFYANRRIMQVIISGFVSLVLVGFGYSSFMRNYTWKTQGTFWADAAEKAPGLVRPHMNLGCYYLSHNMLDEALSEFSAATSGRIISNTTDRGTALYNMGLTYHRKGNLDLALEYYFKAEAASHNSSVDRRNNMGLIFNQKGQVEEAKREYLKALQCNSNVVQPYRNLSLLLLKDGRVEEALKYLHAALRKWPDNTTFLGLAGYAYRFMGSYGKAFLLLERSLAAEAHDPKIHLYISEIYFKRGMEKAAKKEIQQFVATEKEGDLSIYIKGIAVEENNELIKPYKKMVMWQLAELYGDTVDFLASKVSALKGELSALPKTPGELKSLSSKELGRTRKNNLEEFEVMDH